MMKDKLGGIIMKTFFGDKNISPLLSTIENLNLMLKYLNKSVFDFLLFTNSVRLMPFQGLSSVIVFHRIRFNKYFF